MIELKERYEYYSSTGLKFTNWFTIGTFNTKEEAESYLEDYKRKAVNNKRKHEYDICTLK